MNSIPLAERVRPKTVSEFIGQQSIVGKNKIVSSIIDSGKPTNLILWGPPGSGKTTLARIVANETKAEFIEMSAVTSGIADVKKVIKDAEANRRLGMQTVLFIDEIHRFNKAQQDAFLPHVEAGAIALIGATTENPSLEIIRPLLSRSRVVILESLKIDDIVAICRRAAKELGLKNISDEVLSDIARSSGGDARIALGDLELTYNLYGKITKQTLKQSALVKLPNYDKNGDQHFNLASAFIKSMRGSDVNATLYYLARMLQGGEDPKFIARRMMIFASEDIGIAASPALNLAVSTFLAVERIGMPECEYNLYHCAVVLAAAKKSRSIANAMNKATAIAKQTDNLQTPKHLRNASNDFLKDLGYAKDYQWQSDFKHPQGFLPPELKDINLI